MLLRKIQKMSHQYFMNLPSQIVNTFEWKKGDYLGIEVVDKNALVIQKLEFKTSGENIPKRKESENNQTGN